jgi:hypothetical protein
LDLDSRIYTSFRREDFQQDALDKLIGELVNEKFVPYLTSVGGSGLGILSPYTPPNLGQSHTAVVPSGQVTPPETPGLGPTAGDPLLRLAFEKQGIPDLAQWADGLGRWLYV